MRRIEDVGKLQSAMLNSALGVVTKVPLHPQRAGVLTSAEDCGLVGAQRSEMKGYEVLLTDQQALQPGGAISTTGWPVPGGYSVTVVCSSAAPSSD